MWCDTTLSRRDRSGHSRHGLARSAHGCRSSPRPSSPRGISPRERRDQSDIDANPATRLTVTHVRATPQFSCADGLSVSPRCAAARMTLLFVDLEAHQVARLVGGTQRHVRCATSNSQVCAPCSEHSCGHGAHGRGRAVDLHSGKRGNEAESHVPATRYHVRYMCAYCAHRASLDPGARCRSQRPGSRSPLHAPGAPAQLGWPWPGLRLAPAVHITMLRCGLTLATFPYRL
eukprot:3815476-Prymnesium_polylepis.1